MPINVGTLVTQLVADASGMKKGTEEAKSSIKEFVEEQKKLQRESNETREVLKKAFAAETISASLGQLSQALGSVGEDFTDLAASAMDAVGSAIESWGQGGPLGLAIAGVSMGLTAVIDEYQGIQKAAQEAAEAAAAGHRAVVEEIEKQAAALREVNKLAQVQAGARAAGITSEQFSTRQDLAEAGPRKALAEDNLRRRQTELDALQSRMDQFFGARTTGEQIKIAGGQGLREYAESLRSEFATASAALATARENAEGLNAALASAAGKSGVVETAQSAFERRRSLSEQFGDVSKRAEQFGPSAGLGALAEFNKKLADSAKSFDVNQLYEMQHAAKELGKALRLRADAELAEVNSHDHYLQQAYDIRAFRQMAELSRAGADAGPVMPGHAALLASQDEAAKKMEAYERAVGESLEMRKRANEYDKDIEAKRREKEEADQDFEGRKKKDEEKRKKLETAAERFPATFFQIMTNNILETEERSAYMLDMVHGVSDRLRSRVGGISGDVMSAATQGAQSGGVWGAVGAAAVELIGHSKQFQAIVSATNDGLQALSDGLGSILEPLVPIVQVSNAVSGAVGTLLRSLSHLSEVFGLVGPATTVLFDAIKYAGAFIGAVGAGIDWVITATKNAFYSGVASVLETLDEWTGLIPDDYIKSLRDSIVHQASFTEVVGAEWDKYAKLTIGTIGDMTKGMEGVGNSAVNLPAAYRVALAEFNAQRANETGGSPNTWSMGGWRPPAGEASGGVNVYGPITVVASDPRSFAAELQKIQRRKALLENGSAA